MQILVTGAGGRIGCRFIEKLAISSYQVKALARSDKPHLRLADEVVLKNLSPSSDFEELLEGVDTLIHLADGFNAYEHLPVEHDNTDAEARLLTIELLAKAAANKKIRFIYLSTIKTMCGTFSDEILMEEMEPRPQSLYGRLKLAGERAIIERARKCHSTAIILRFPIVFGNDVGGNMERLMALVDTPYPLPFKGVEKRRSFMSVDSLIDVVLTILKSDIKGQHMFLVQDGSLTIEELIVLLREALGRKHHMFRLPRPVWSLLEKLPIIGCNVQRFTRALEVNDSKFRIHFNWQPPIDLHKSLVQMVGNKSR